MNKQRRKDIQEIRAEIEALRERVENIGGDEREYIDNMPEGIQMSERGEKAEDAAANLEYAQSSLEEALDYLDSAAE